MASVHSRKGRLEYSGACVRLQVAFAFRGVDPIFLYRTLIPIAFRLYTKPRTYVCMYVCMYVCISVYMYVCTIYLFIYCMLHY